MKNFWYIALLVSTIIFGVCFNAIVDKINIFIGVGLHLLPLTLLVLSIYLCSYIEKKFKNRN